MANNHREMGYVSHGGFEAKVGKNAHGDLFLIHPADDERFVFVRVAHTILDVQGSMIRALALLYEVPVETIHTCMRLKGEPIFNNGRRT